MNWTDAGDLLFLVGALLAAGLFVYGGWLSLSAPEEDPHKVRERGQARGAASGSRRLPLQPGDAPRRTGGDTASGSNGSRNFAA